MYKVSNRWPHQNQIKVEWNLGKRCNYDCTYCPSIIHDQTSPHTDIEKLKTTVDTLINLDKPIRLSFTGGEPCVHPKFDELIKYAKHKGIQWISITTNGSRPFEFYQMLSNYVNQYVVSIHFEHNWMRVINTLTKLSEKTNVALIGQIMAHHDYMDNVKIVKGILQQEGIPSTVRRIRWTEGDHDLFDDLRYHPDDLEWIKSQDSTVQPNVVIDDEQLLHANDIIKLHLNQYKGWECSAGLESLMINWDGEVHRATCRVGGSLGNVYNNTFNIPTTSIICTRNWCTCTADIPLTKKKI